MPIIQKGLGINLNKLWHITLPKFLQLQTKVETYHNLNVVGVGAHD